jgi:hypothetical protein
LGVASPDVNGFRDIREFREFRESYAGISSEVLSPKFEPAFIDRQHLERGLVCFDPPALLSSAVHV